MPNHQQLHSINLQGTIDNSSPRFSQSSVNSLSEHSWNAITTAEGFTRGWNGATSQGVGTGSRKMLPVGRQWGGIKDIGLVKGSGNFFEDIGKSRWGIGSGQPHIEGADIPDFTLTTNLQVSVAVNGVYSPAVNAGLSQPSAPELGIIALTGDVSNPVSAKLERRRPSTGARSLASPTSAVVVPQGNRVRVTFPTATVGQTHWRVYFTFQGFGGTGVHYLALYGGTVDDIPESVIAAGNVDDIPRSLEFNYKDGDLVPLEASYDDYAPPAGTGAIKLQNVCNITGCYSDSVSSPTSTSAGTAIAVSKINNNESYVPTHLLFLPEQITDVLARAIDDFGYIACENSVYAIQYVGFRGDELPPCTITAVLPDIGIQYPHNWASFRGQLLLYTAEGNLLLMTESGAFDSTFAAPIKRIIQNWMPADTIVGYDPKNDLLIVGNGKRILVYSIAARGWRQIWMPDFGIAGNITACTTSKRRLFFTVTNGAAKTAYSFDTNTQTAPISLVSNYQNAPTGNGYVKDLAEMAISAETGANTQMVVCLSKNLHQQAFRSVAIVAGSANVTDATANFSTDLIGRQVVIFADNIGGAGVDYLRGRVSAISGANLTLTNLQGGAVSSQITAADLLMFVGDFVEVRTINNQGLHFANFFPNLPECRSFSVSIWLKGQNNIGNVLSADVFGITYQSSRAF